MTDATAYSQDQWIGMFFEGTSPDGPVDGPAVALWSTNPADDPDFANEVGASGYSRVATTGSDWSRVTPAGTETGVENAVDFDFGVLSESGQTSIEGVVLVREDLTNDQAIYASGTISEVVDTYNKFRIDAGQATFDID